jgi:thiol-disulfide isomerase/thioredoxin
MANTPANKTTPSKGANRGSTARRGATGRPAGLFTWVAVGVVVALILVIVIVKVTGSDATNNSSGTTPVSPAVMAELTGIPAATFNAVGTKSPVVAVDPPASVPGQPALLWADTNGVKRPSVFYYGAEYCPYCAAERWPLIIALSRFGSFSNLHETFSSSADVYPSTPTFTFYQSTYRSPYLNFFPIEALSNVLVNGSYTTLMTPTKEQAALVAKYDTSTYIPGAGDGSIPFITINNRFMLSGASYSPSALAGSTHNQIAGALSDASNPLTKGILTAANYLTATMCVATKDQPSNVCSSPAIHTANKALGIKASS